MSDESIDTFPDHLSKLTDWAEQFGIEIVIAPRYKVIKSKTPQPVRKDGKPTYYIQVRNPRSCATDEASGRSIEEAATLMCAQQKVE